MIKKTGNDNSVKASALEEVQGGQGSGHGHFVSVGVDLRVGGRRGKRTSKPEKRPNKRPNKRVTVNTTMAQKLAGTSNLETDGRRLFNDGKQVRDLTLNDLTR